MKIKLEIGKKYLRRDGRMVVAKKAHKLFDAAEVLYVGLKEEPEAIGSDHAYIRNGCIHYQDPGDEGLNHKHDIVGEVQEPVEKPAKVVVNLQATQQTKESKMQLTINKPEPTFFGDLGVGTIFAIKAVLYIKFDEEEGLVLGGTNLAFAPGKTRFIGKDVEVSPVKSMTVEV